MKKDILKISGVKYKINFTPIELRNTLNDYKKEMTLGNIRNIKTYFAEACLTEKNLKKDPSAFEALMNWYNLKLQQLTRLGKTYVFGKEIQSVIHHKGSADVKKTFTTIEKDLLGFLVLQSRKNKKLVVELIPGFLIKIQGVRTIEILFDYKQNIRNY